MSTNRLLQTVPVGPSPDQITFTRDFAYVRSSGNEFVTMINITGLGGEGHNVSVNRFPAGQRAPRESSSTSLADAIVPAPEGGAVLVANPADKMIYFYTEGMAAPMGSFQNYRRDPRATLVLDNSLRESSPGVYTTTVRFNGRGHYDVAFLLDSPRMLDSTGALDIQDIPKTLLVVGGGYIGLELGSVYAALGTRVTVVEMTDGLLPGADRDLVLPLHKRLEKAFDAIRVGEKFQLRFKVVDAGSNQPKADLKDMGVLVFLAPGIWQQREWAKPVGDGVYELSFVPPQSGVYYVFFQCPSLGVQFNQIPYLILQATKDNATSKETQP